MKTPKTAFDSNRRDLLRLSSMGLAASAVTAVPALAAAPKKASPVAMTPAYFDVRNFGKTIDTPAINRAIEAAAAAGGGTVLVPAGTYICFSIRLKSKVDIFLSQGSTIIAADSPKPGETTGYMGGTYDPAEPNTTYDAYQDYGHNHWHNSLFWGENIAPARWLRSGAHGPSGCGRGVPAAGSSVAGYRGLGSCRTSCNEAGGSGWTRRWRPRSRFRSAHSWRLPHVSG